MRQILNFRDVEIELTQLRNELDKSRSRNLNMGQRRIVNAAPSVDEYDYVIRKELWKVELDFQTLVNSIVELASIKSRLLKLENP